MKKRPTEPILPKRWKAQPHFLMRSTGIEFELIESLSFSETYARFHSGPAKKSARHPIDEKDRLLFEDELGRQEKKLWQVFRREDIQEALYLQNPSLWSDINRLIGKGLSGRNWKVREKEQKMVLYLQRFCAKNETHSFFGPTVWGRMTEDAGNRLAFKMSSAPWIARRRVTLETWAVEHLAALMSGDPSVRPYIPLKLSPEYRIEGGSVRRGHDTVFSDLTGPDRTVLSAAAQGKTRAEIGSGDVDPVISRWVRKGVVLDRLLILRSWPDPLRVLSEWAGRLPADCPSRGHWVELLSKMAGWGEALAVLSGPAKIRRIEQYEEEFRRLAGTAPRREGEGRVHTGRTLFFEAAERRVEGLQWGRALRDDFSERMSIYVRLFLLHAIAKTGDLMAALEAYRREKPGKDLWLEDVWRKIDEWKGNPWTLRVRRIHDRITAELEKVIDRKTGVCRLTWDQFGFLDDLIEDEGEAGLEYLQVPFDVFLSAESPEAVNAGDYQWVLGEVNFCNYPILLKTLFAWNAPSMESVRRQEASYFRKDRLHAFQGSALRDQRARWEGLERLVSIEHDAHMTNIGNGPEATVPVGEMRLEKDADGWVLKRVGRDQTYFPMDIFYEGFPRRGLTDSIFPHSYVPQKHCPRIVLENIVLERERWLLTDEDLKRYRFDSAGMDLFSEFIRFQRDHRMPRYVFVKVNQEDKPVFLDFGNYFLIEAVARLIRPAREILVTEMVPDPDHLWLRDDRGRYTCEFRVSCGLNRSEE
ncbi:MAG TPA: lantibiotic dehydratase [Elusimicrobiota bacterium]|nr:lantibiotic dehydratase [Elusimicrobiota bacterium]